MPVRGLLLNGLLVNCWFQMLLESDETELQPAGQHYQARGDKEGSHHPAGSVALGNLRSCLRTAPRLPREGGVPAPVGAPLGAPHLCEEPGGKGRAQSDTG